MTFDNFSTGSSGSDGTSLSWSHVLGALGTAGRILVTIQAEYFSGGVYAQSVIFNGVSMTLVGRDQGSGSHNSFVEMWELKDTNIPAGTYTIAVDYGSSNTSKSRAGGAMSFGDMANVSVEAVATGNASGTSPFTVNITTISANSLLVTAYGNQNVGIPSFSTGETKKYDSIPVSGEQSIVTGAYRIVAATGSASVTLTVTNPEGEAMIIASFNNNASSPSASLSPSSSSSASASASISPSSSASPSASISASASSSPSASVSASTSSSVSSSPSEGFEDFTREAVLTLPLDDSDLSTPYSTEDRIGVSTYDGVKVGQEGQLEYMIHQFKVFIGDIVDDPTILFKGQSVLAPSLSPVYLQIYNQVSHLWETLDSNNFTNAYTDFRLAGDILNFTNYRNPDNEISCRVWQLGI